MTRIVLSKKLLYIAVAGWGEIYADSEKIRVRYSITSSTS